MKRTICFILTLALMLYLASPCLAAEDLGSIKESAELYYCYSTAFDGVYKSMTDEYALRYEDEEGNYVFLPVTRIDVDMTNRDEVSAFLARKDIPKDILETFDSRCKEQMLTGNEASRNAFNGIKETPVATLFAPKGITTLANGNPDETITYTHRGTQMMSYRFYYYTLSSGWKTIKTGTNTKTVANAVYECALVAASLASKGVSYLDSAINILRAVYDAWGVVYITAHNNDYLYARIVWDQVDQYTYAHLNGGWQLGLYSQKITVSRIGTEQYYYNTNRQPFLTDRYVSVTQETANYSSPWEMTWQYAGLCYFEYVSWSTGGISFTFDRR